MSSRCAALTFPKMLCLISLKQEGHTFHEVVVHAAHGFLEHAWPLGVAALRVSIKMDCCCIWLTS